MESELQSKTVWESKGSRVPRTFKEESEVREFSLASFEMSCIKMCSAGRQRLTESSDKTRTRNKTPPTDVCRGTRALRWGKDTSPASVGTNEQTGTGL